MIPKYLASDFYYTTTLLGSTFVETTIKILREHIVYITINGTSILDIDYNLTVDPSTEYVSVLFKRKQYGKLCVFRVSNKQDFLGLGTEKSKDQNEKFFDKLVQYVQDEKRERESSDGTIDTRVDRSNANPFTKDATNKLNDEGKRLRLNQKVYKEYMDFSFRINGYDGDIALNLPNLGNFGDHCEYIVPIDTGYVYEQDVETGISKFINNGYTLIKSISFDANHITTLVLYRRLMDNKAPKYNMQKAMIGTTSKTARIVTGNVTYYCSVKHRYDTILLTVENSLPLERTLDTQNKIYIDLSGYSVPLYIQNNGITMNGFA